MAAETSTRDETAFGEVSQTAGIVFQYVLLAATVVGLASLAVLLLYVTNDALEPFEADAGWYLVYFLTFLLPAFLVASWLAARNGSLGGIELALPYAMLALALGAAVSGLTALQGTMGSALLLFSSVCLVVGAAGYNARNLSRHGEATWKFGISTLGVAVAGPFVAGGLLIFFEIVPFQPWFAHVTAVAVVTAVLVSAGRRVEEFSTVGSGIAIVGGYGFALIGIPPISLGIPRIAVGDTVLVPSLSVSTPELLPSLAELILRHSPVLPTRLVTYALTLAVPAGALATVALRRRELGERLGRERLDVATGATAIAVPVVGGIIVADLTDIAPASGLILLLSMVVPVGYYAGSRGADPVQEGTDGLLIPAVIVGGAVVGALTIEQTGFAGPASWLDWQFLTSLPSPFPERAGIYPALVGSLLLMLVVVVMAFPVGVGAAVYLEEYAPDNRITRFIQVNIANLAGVPSVVYGLLGLSLFIQLLNLGIGSVLVGGITLSLLILPIVIISAQEAIRSVPDAYREASAGMGATQYQTVRNVVLPEAFPGILTGTILAIGRAIGETAPLIMIGAANVTYSIPTGLTDGVSAMPMQVYTWASSSKLTFQDSVLAAGVVTMVVVLLVINSVAIVLRNTYQHEQ